MKCEIQKKIRQRELKRIEEIKVHIGFAASFACKHIKTESLFPKEFKFTIMNHKKGIIDW